MIKKSIMFIMLLLFGFQISMAETDILTCSFETSCDGGVNMFYANHNFVDSDGKILSSNIAKNKDSNYNLGLCCRINSDKIDGSLSSNIFTYDHVNNSCPSGSNALFYLTDSINSRLGILNYGIDSVNSNFNSNDYGFKTCFDFPDEFSKLDIIISDDLRYKNIGYDCLFKVSNISNGLVSSCDAKFDGGKKYEYTIWGKLWENINSLKCNSDCTSKLDNRVYSACSQKINICKLVPIECDGSLYGAWVKYDSNHDGVVNASDLGEIQCSVPWDNIRGGKFTNLPLKIDSNQDKCSNLIKKKYPVMMDNELVTMDIFICGDKNGN